MNYINDYKIFEALTEYDDMMGKILHLYGSIPLPKEKSAIVINKIITNISPKNASTVPIFIII